MTTIVCPEHVFGALELCLFCFVTHNPACLYWVQFYILVIRLLVAFNLVVHCCLRLLQPLCFVLFDEEIIPRVGFFFQKYRGIFQNKDSGSVFFTKEYEIIMVLELNYMDQKYYI